MNKLPFLSRAAFARITTPIARGLLRVGLTPDVVTILGTTASVAGALTLFPMGKLFAGACGVVLRVVRHAGRGDGPGARGRHSLRRGAGRHL